ncbi:MAG: 5'-3'-deoxyribonucleotidase [Siphonobacter aquaeclarae]|nr:5'-3'-deoxyribonucleotidase [Siphonobacter aquaeclarae]
MKRILIDMDDVLADASARFAEYATERMGKAVSKELLQGHNWAASIDIHADTVKSWVHEPGFFRGMQVMPDAQDVVRRLMEQYEVFIVSAAIEFPNSLKEKVEWLAEHFAFIDWRYIVLCGHKWMIDADYLIDDHEKNLATFRGTPILFDAPHNQSLTGFQRVKSWKDVESLLLNEQVPV